YVSTGFPTGPVTRIGCRIASGIAAETAASVPSPPSAKGRVTTVSSGRTRLHPRSSAAATTCAAADPLNESGAMTTVTDSARPLRSIASVRPNTIRLLLKPWASRQEPRTQPHDEAPPDEVPEADPEHVARKQRCCGIQVTGEHTEPIE